MLTLLNELFDPITTQEVRVSILEKIDSFTITADILEMIVRYIKGMQTFQCPIPRAIDIVGTGGSGLQRINTSTIVSILASHEGIPIVKHGNNAASGRVGSFDLLQSLGYNIPKNADEVYKNLENTNLACLYAKAFFPCMKLIAEARKTYGRPTIFNLIGPLLSPAEPELQLIGCAREDMMEIMAMVAGRLGRRLVWVVRGEDGLDEITLTGVTHVVEYKSGHITSFTLCPEDYGYKRCLFSEIEGGDIEYNTTLARSIIEGTCISRHRDLVELNLQIVRLLYDKYLKIPRKIKICGLQKPLPSYEGISYVGLNMIPTSRRYISLEQAGCIVETLPLATQAVLITQDMTLEEVVYLAKNTNVKIIQLHGQETPEFCALLKEKDFTVWKALPAGDFMKAEEYTQSVDMFIFDGLVPGSGKEYDYSILRNCHYPFLVAGGVTVENKDSILTLLPHAMGLDIASGSETDGEKDMEKIVLFTKNN